MTDKTQTTAQWLAASVAIRAQAIEQGRVVQCTRCGFEAECQEPCCPNEGICHVCGAGFLMRAEDWGQ